MRSDRQRLERRAREGDTHAVQLLHRLQQRRNDLLLPCVDPESWGGDSETPESGCVALGGGNGWGIGVTYGRWDGEGWGGGHGHGVEGGGEGDGGGDGDMILGIFWVGGGNGDGYGRER